MIALCQLSILIDVYAVDRDVDLLRQLHDHRLQAAAVAAPWCAEASDHIALFQRLVEIFCACDHLDHGWYLLL